MQQLIINQPPTLNELINLCRSNKYAAATSKKKWTNIAARAALKQMIPFDHDRQIRIIATLSYVTSASDGDNLNSCVKYILDGVAKAEIIKQDNLSTIVEPQIFFYNKIKRGEQKTAKVLFFDDLDEWLDYTHKELAKIK